jgi:CBS domain-containing protein
MRIADVLRNKGASVATVSPGVTVAEVLAELAHWNCGALPVVDDGRLVGIVSERDVVRQLYRHGAGLMGDPVSEIMTSAVVTCSPEDKATELARVMTEMRVRHVPVMVDGKLSGIVSIGDVVKARIDELEEERTQLQSYIAG